MKAAAFVARGLLAIAGGLVILVISAAVALASWVYALVDEDEP
jgi:hypothetical protein